MADITVMSHGYLGLFRGRHIYYCVSSGTKDTATTDEMMGIQLPFRLLAAVSSDLEGRDAQTSPSPPHEAAH